MAALDPRKIVCLLLAVLLAPYCGHLGTSAPAAQPRPALVAERVRALNAELPEAEVEISPEGDRVARIRRLVADATATGGAADIALHILRKPVVGAALGLSPSLDELCSPIERQDLQLADHAVVRMPQCVGNVRVLGGEIAMNVRVKPQPAILTLTNGLRPIVSRDTRAKVSGADAIKAAGAAGAPSPELVIFDPSAFQLSGPIRLCWLVTRGTTNVLVDATNGSIVREYTAVIRGSLDAGQR
jgi:hypothetical protein